MKQAHQLLIGFALETQNEIEHAQGKLKRKNLDAIILNSLSDNGAGFKHDSNKISIFDRYNNSQHFELKDKKEVAKDILNYIEKLINA
jgi:phosphopantothenoylcysteine decarboxylase/phosphopantothenate--cysteine ligase